MVLFSYPISCRICLLIFHVLVLGLCPSTLRTVFVSCNGSYDTAEEHQRKENRLAVAVAVVRRKLSRSGFSNSFSSHDLSSFDVDEEEKGKKDEIAESSPRGVLEDCTITLESEVPINPSTSYSLESDMARSSGSEGQPNLLLAPAWRDIFRVFRKGPSTRVQTFSPAQKRIPKLTRWKTRKMSEAFIPPMSSPLETEFYCLKSSWKNFSLSQLQAATNNFSHENLIGEGGYAEVYKGQLQDGQFVAIKRLTRGSPEEMTVDYLSELGIIVHVDHPNIAKLIGYGVEGGMHLVLELSVNGSLASLLYGPKEKLDWGIRYKIALGTAQGLLYLHEECQRRIIHKDIKASNILLTEDFEPQISDFGLAKWLPEEWTHHIVSKIEGTFGYLPPEFFMHGIVDEKTDVYAYGVLLLELITGRQALDTSQQSLVMWAKPLLLKDSIKELTDPALSDAYDLEQMECVVCVASMCVHQSSTERPRMGQVVKVLKGDESSLQEAKRSQKCKLQRTHSEELVDAEDYNSTKYLNDLNRHMEIVLGDNNEGYEEHNSPTHLNDLNGQMEVALVDTES